VSEGSNCRRICLPVKVLTRISMDMTWAPVIGMSVSCSCLVVSSVVNSFYLAIIAVVKSRI
jgi:hypothetical protein